MHAGKALTPSLSSPSTGPLRGANIGYADPLRGANIGYADPLRGANIGYADPLRGANIGYADVIGCAGSPCQREMGLSGRRRG